eukprot:12934259-Prorocentrum_lima.AAC.1
MKLPRDAQQNLIGGGNSCLPRPSWLYSALTSSAAPRSLVFFSIRYTKRRVVSALHIGTLLPRVVVGCADDSPLTLWSTKEFLYFQDLRKPLSHFTIRSKAFLAFS